MSLWVKASNWGTYPGLIQLNLDGLAAQPSGIVAANGIVKLLHHDICQVQASAIPLNQLCR